jgi:flavin-dependent dehydrogenase
VTFDVVIVGGGPVGLVAAIEARLAGLSAVVLEQRSGVIDKACGEGLMPGAIPLLARLGVDPVGVPLRGITYNQGTRSVTHRFAGEPGRGVRRTALHDALRARALELGVELCTSKVDSIDQDESGVRVGAVQASTVQGSTVQASTVQASTVQTSYVLACDGLHSTVARLVGLTLPAPVRRRRYGIRQHYAVAPWGDTVEIHYARSAEIYVTPIAPDEVGIAMLGAQHTDFDAVIAGIPDLAARLAGATVASSRRGAGPFRQRTRARTAGRVMLVGDASGYVDAITGEGLRLGFAQAGAAISCIVSGDPARYEIEWRRITRDFRITTTALVRIATSPLRRAIVPLSATLPGRFGAVVESLAR